MRCSKYLQKHFFKGFVLYDIIKFLEKELLIVPKNIWKKWNLAKKSKNCYLAGWYSQEQPLQSWAKYLAQIKEIQQNWTRLQKFDH